MKELLIFFISINSLFIEFKGRMEQQAGLLDETVAFAVSMREFRAKRHENSWVSLEGWYKRHSLIRAIWGTKSPGTNTYTAQSRLGCMRSLLLVRRVRNHKNNIIELNNSRAFVWFNYRTQLLYDVRVRRGSSTQKAPRTATTIKSFIAQLMNIHGNILRIINSCTTVWWSGYVCDFLLC